MVCDLRAILHNDGAELPFSGAVSLEEGALGADVAFENGVAVCGKLTCRGDVLELCAHVEGDFKVRCARCLKPLDHTVAFDLEETLVAEGEEIADRDSVVVFSGYSLDLSEIVASNILLHLSYRYLCKEDCRGLCPVCGADLNCGDCGCRQEEIDPRWEKLKNFK